MVTCAFGLVMRCSLISPTLVKFLDVLLFFGGPVAGGHIVFDASSFLAVGQGCHGEPVGRFHFPMNSENTDQDCDGREQTGDRGYKSRDHPNEQSTVHVTGPQIPSSVKRKRCCTLRTDCSVAGP